MVLFFLTKWSIDSKLNAGLLSIDHFTFSKSIEISIWEGIMSDLKLGVIESRFAELIWSREPLSSGELVKLCQQELGWKKSTTYTVLRKLCERGIFQNEDGKVTSLISKEEFYALQSEQFVEENFKGSLPAFLTAFTRRKKFSKQEIEELQKLIDESKNV